MLLMPETTFSVDTTSAALKFGYDAVVPRNRRRAPTGYTRSEDAELDATKRRQLISASRDIQRNYTVAAWAIRRHLDYCTTFRFQSRSGDPALDRRFEALVTEAEKPANFDAAGRHSRARFTRLAEARAVLDGDIFTYRLNDGTLQAIEADRVKTGIIPAEAIDIERLARMTHGVETDDRGRMLAIAVHKRQRTNDFSPTSDLMTFDRMVAAPLVYHHGFFDRFDQVRGVSPLAPALNNLQDSYEGIDYALARAKVSQLFALAIYRGNPDLVSERDENSTNYNKIPLDGPSVLDLDLGDRAEFLESSTPAAEFQTFQTLVIQLALKALDIPFSFFSENFTNYSGARQAFLQYERSAQFRQEEIRTFLGWWVQWKAAIWLLDGLISREEWIRFRFEWVHEGLPWLDPLKETQANLSALSAGLTSRRRICKASGIEWDQIVSELAEEQTALTAAGLPTSINPDNALIKDLVTNAEV